MIAQNKRFAGIILAAVLLLFIPLIAMQFTDVVKWTLSDFIIAGGLLFSTGIAFELAMRSVNGLWYRIAICVFFISLLVLIWAELAVGLFGTSLAGS